MLLIFYAKIKYNNTKMFGVGIVKIYKYKYENATVSKNLFKAVGFIFSVDIVLNDFEKTYQIC